MQLAKLLLLGLVAAAILLAVACGGGVWERHSDAKALRDQVVAAMNGLESYRVNMDLGAGEPIVIEYKKPNSYRSQVIAKR